MAHMTEAGVFLQMGLTERMQGAKLQMMEAIEGLKAELLVDSLPTQAQDVPRISRFEINSNCGQAGNLHHCAKHCVAAVEIEGFATEPHIKVHERDQRFQGVHSSADNSLECELHFGATAIAPAGFIVLQLDIRVETVGEKVAPNKPAVGLQFCKPGGMQKRFASCAWDPHKKIATIQLRIRARRIHQCVGKNRWEFHDDAGSGIRGKPHSASLFRFSAILNPFLKNQVVPKYCDIRVWSKGNCPDRKRRRNAEAPRNADFQRMVPANYLYANGQKRRQLPGLPLLAPAPMLHKEHERTMPNAPLDALEMLAVLASSGNATSGNAPSIPTRVARHPFTAMQEAATEAATALLAKQAAM
jgi:hypothetical protein